MKGPSAVRGKTSRIPRSGRVAAGSSHKHDLQISTTGEAARITRRRVTQERIDRMADLRRQGLPFAEIGVRLGCSERTARRYAGKVQPQLHLPEATPGLDTDPRSVRERLVTRYLQLLHDDERLQSLTSIWRQVTPAYREVVYGGPPSILFLNEAERLLRERLDTIGVVTLRMLAENGQSRARFLREVVGELYSDYVWWHELADMMDPEGAREDWRPARERPPIPDFDPNEVQNPHGFPE
jgi:hypothetical protein